ncbi:MAG: hypothetical protein RL748_3621 [Pseudomonadota bacterium]
MKFILFLLLLANGGLFAYHQGYLQDVFPSSHEPQRLARQLHPEKVRLLAADQALIPASADASAAGASDNASTPPVSASASASTNTGNETIACLEIGDFGVADGKRFETALAALALGDRQTRRNVPEVSSYVVYIPPLPNKEAADKKASELRSLKISDFFIINDPNSPLRWSISLGTFKTKLAATSQLEILTKQGVRSAVLGTRNNGTGKLSFQLHKLTAENKTALDNLLQKFPDHQPKACIK